MLSSINQYIGNTPLSPNPSRTVLDRIRTIPYQGRGTLGSSLIWLSTGTVRRQVWGKRCRFREVRNTVRAMVRVSDLVLSIL